MKRPNEKAKFPRPDEAELEMELATPTNLHHTSGAHGSGTEHPEHESEQAREQARQQAMAARERLNRTHMPVGQPGTLREKRGDQPRGGA